MLTKNHLMLPSIYISYVATKTNETSERIIDRKYQALLHKIIYSICKLGL